MMIQATAEQLNGLASKLDGLELRDRERAILEEVLIRAATGPELFRALRAGEDAGSLSPTAAKLLAAGGGTGGSASRRNP